MPAPAPRRLGLDVRLTYYRPGGISTYIRRMAACLPELAPQDAHWHFYRRGHLAAFSARARRVDCWTPAHHWLEPAALSVEVSRARLDLLHSPDFIPPLWGYRRSVITVHDLTFLRYPEFLTAESRRYYNGQIRMAVKLSDAISADSRATAADLVELLSVPPEKITVIPLGLDDAYRPLEPAAISPVLDRHGLPRGYLLFVGTFEPRKNVPGLFAAYFRLRQRMPDAPPLVLAGHRGWLFDATQSLMRDLGLERHIRFLEDVPAEEMPALYNGAEAFVLLSHYEGFGFPVLEAMGCGTPAVISDRASLPEVAGGAALAVAPDDPDAAAEALWRILTESGPRHALRAQGLEQARKFTWEATARATLALYDRVMEEA